MGAGLGNNILPAMPELHQLFETPTVRGGLTSILGRGFALHGHRHMHQSSTADQDFHKVCVLQLVTSYSNNSFEGPSDLMYVHPHLVVWKDSFWGRRRMRSHAPRWAMLLYYPQPVSSTLGPTNVLNGSNFWTTDHEGVDSADATRRSVGGDGEPYGEDRVDWPGLMSGLYRSSDLSRRDKAINTAHTTALLGGHGGDASDEGMQNASTAAGVLKPVALTAKRAGKVVIMHYDLFHRASRREDTSDKVPTRCCSTQVVLADCVNYMRTYTHTFSRSSLYPRLCIITQLCHVWSVACPAT